MQDNIQNRTADVRGRGRPPKSIPTPLPEPVENIEVPQKPLPGITCPCCGRGMVPRRDRVQENKCYARCSLCDGRMVLTFENSGKYVSVRRL